MAAITWLSFDLDDTLWPCEPTILAAEAELYDWLRNNVVEFTELLGPGDLHEHRREFMRAHTDIAHDLTKVRIASLRDLATRTGIDDDWVDEAFQVYYEARQRVSLYEDVEPVLDELKLRYRLSAVTNGNADIHLTGVGHWFEHSMSAARAGCRKSDTSFFEQLLDELQTTPDNIIHIGDDPVQDVFGAARVGIRTIWLNRDGKDWVPAEWAADHHARSLPEVVEILYGLET